VLCGAEVPIMDMDDVSPPADYQGRYTGEAGRTFEPQFGQNPYFSRYQGPKQIAGQLQEPVEVIREVSDINCTQNQCFKDPRTASRKPHARYISSIPALSAPMSAQERVPSTATTTTPAIDGESETLACAVHQSDRIAALSHAANNSVAPRQLSDEETDFPSTGCFETDDIDAILEVSEAAFSKQHASIRASSRQSQVVRDTQGNDASNTSDDHPDLLADDILIGLYQAALSSNSDHIGGRSNGMPRHRSPALRAHTPVYLKSFELNGENCIEEVTRFDLESQASSPTRVDVSNDDPEKCIALSDQYDDLSDDIKLRIDALREKISQMPRRKLRESLADKVTLTDIEPLMAVNRDDLATMLSLGVTTWKSFVHQELGISRWPARSLKSSAAKSRETKERLLMAVEEGRSEDVVALHMELQRLQSDHEHIMEQLRAAARSRRAEKYKAEQAFDEAIGVFAAHEGIEDRIEMESQRDYHRNADANNDGRKRRKVC
jgi:hypothetical protein